MFYDDNNNYHLKPKML